jgi:hypothetical protein
MNQNASLFKDVLEKAIGSKLIDIVVDTDEFGDEWLGLVLEKGRKHKTQWVLWVSRDAEGNGPGWIDILKRVARDGVDPDTVPFEKPQKDFNFAFLKARGREHVAKKRSS